MIGLQDSEARLALANPGYTATAVTIRFDAFVDGDDIKFVEYNSENPSSLSDQDGLNQVLFEIAALQKHGIPLPAPPIDAVATLA